MASSSSSSEPIPTSFSQSWNYDVFLSFRGEDTRKKFVDHLYKALVQEGIHVYKDDETLPRGESIRPSLLKAIKESRIAVIVFSENYANSTWCLDELEYIIECMDKRGQIVMPIFYDIDPSDVRNQKGKYEILLAKHKREENKHKVISWKKALKEASNVSGWATRDFANGHEADCIKDIVGKISDRLSPVFTNVETDLIGIETRLLDLKSKLDIESNRVRMVGIWGVGGGGKTTLAFAAYTELFYQFNARCFLENIRDESSKHGLKRLQEKLLSAILKIGVELNSEKEGRNMIKSRLYNKKVVVVLDDVDDIEQLKALAGSHDWFGEGSRIIITTRDQQLLSRMADAIYEVSLLAHDEALKLFTRHAYRENKPVEDYKMLSLDVVSYAGGLPLALEILGSFLYDKDKDQWKSVLAKLKDIPDVKVSDRLKISYDGLERCEKELFLDIACFLRRWPISRAMRVLDACSFHPGIGVEVLVQKSLIKKSNGIFDMHDLVEEMAHYIVREQHPSHPEKHSRIWQEKDIVEFCAMGAENFMENNHIEVLALPSYTSDSLPRFGAIKGDLKLLLDTSSLPSYVRNPRLPDVVANMKNLRLIYWEGYPSYSLPINFQPIKLGCLILIGGDLTQLWQGCKDLPNLKILDLRYSYLLKSTPDFNGLPCLETLILEGCVDLKEIHPSIGSHERLVFVNMKECSRLKTFPPIIRMKNLETLDLSSCLRFQQFPDIQTNMDSLANLHLDHTNIEIIPSSVGQFCTNLISFHLTYCSKLKRIEGSFRLLKRLKDLHLYGCNKLEKLTRDFFDEACCLEVLSLSIKSQDSSSFIKNLMDCKWLQILQSFHGSTSMKLPQFPRFLRKLDLSWCHLGDGDIPSDISELLNLQVLNLSGNKFSRLHSLSRIVCLKFLNLSSCRSLVELPDLPSSIAFLKANECDSLESIGDLPDYKCLWKVSLGRKNKLIGGERVLHSMLQANAVEDRFMSVQLPLVPLATSTFCNYTRTLITLQLPQNWDSDFSGFLLCADNYPLRGDCSIVIKQGMSMGSQPHHHRWDEFDKNPESFEYALVGYLPFGSLRRTAWWNSTYTNLTFQTEGMGNPKVGLVPRKSKVGDSRESAKSSIDGSQFWDEEDERGKTFKIEYDSCSKIKIVWSHCYFSSILLK